VSRELARNTGPGGRYGVAAAQRLAATRRCRPRLRRLERDQHQAIASGIHNSSSAAPRWCS